MITSKITRTNEFECRDIRFTDAQKIYIYTNKPTDRQQRKSEYMYYRENRDVCQNYLECFVMMVACLCTPIPLQTCERCLRQQRKCVCHSISQHTQLHVVHDTT